MFSALTDTDEATAAWQMEMLRRAPPERRLALALSLSRSVITLSRRALERQLPRASADEVGLRFVARHYGADLASGVETALAARRS